MLKTIAKICILFTVHLSECHLIHEKPKTISNKELIALQDKWSTHFTWTRKKLIHCSLNYENGKAGFAFHVGPIPVYFKNYRILPTKEELLQIFSLPSYFFAQPLDILNPTPKHIDVDSLATFLKTHKVLFYTGAGISAGTVATMNQLEKAVCINNGPYNFLKTAWYNPEQLIQQFSHFCASAIHGKPTAAHWALKTISEKISAAVVTENVDLLQQKTGIEPIWPYSDDFYTISKNDLRAIDAIVCIGLSHDDRGLLSFYKKNNPSGKIIAIDLKVPCYLSHHDYVCIGNIQEILPQLATL